MTTTSEYLAGAAVAITTSQRLAVDVPVDASWPDVAAVARSVLTRDYVSARTRSGAWPLLAALREVGA